MQVYVQCCNPKRETCYCHTCFTQPRLPFTRTRKRFNITFKHKAVTPREIMLRHTFDLTSRWRANNSYQKHTFKSRGSGCCDIGISHYSYKQDSHTSRWENIAFNIPPHPLMGGCTYVYTMSNKKRTCVTEELRVKPDKWNKIPTFRPLFM